MDSTGNNEVVNWLFPMTSTLVPSNRRSWEGVGGRVASRC